MLHVCSLSRLQETVDSAGATHLVTLINADTDVPTPAGVQFALDQGCEPAYADLEEGDAIFCKLPRSRKLGLWLLRRL